MYGDFRQHIRLTVIDEGGSIMEVLMTTLIIVFGPLSAIHEEEKFTTMAICQQIKMQRDGVEVVKLGNSEDLVMKIITRVKCVPTLPTTK